MVEVRRPRCRSQQQQQQQRPRPLAGPELDEASNSSSLSLPAGEPPCYLMPGAGTLARACMREKEKKCAFEEIL